MTTTITRPRRNDARGFSLLEVLVASTIGIVLLSIIVGIWVQVDSIASRGRLQAQMEREAAFAGRLIAQDLRMTGLGVPAGGHIQHSCSGGRCTSLYGTVAPSRFYASVLVAAKDQVGILGDLTRPNAQYNTFGPLSSYRTGGVDSVAWTTENNGLCSPPVAGGPAPPNPCNTADTSFFFPGISGCTRSALDRLCPWGMNRVQKGDRIQIVAGNGNWSTAAASSPLQLTGALGTGALQLSVPFDRTGADNVWRNADIDGAGPGGIPGAGWVTTLDRVFYRQNGDVLERIQCWGDPDPDAPAWPGPTATTVPADPAITPVASGVSVAKNECTRPEVVARFVKSFEVRYFDDGGVELGAPISSAAGKRSVHRIDYVLTLHRDMHGRARNIDKSAVGSVRLANVP